MVDELTALMGTAEMPKTADDKSNPQTKVVRGPKKEYRSVPTGRAYVHASYNNTIVTLTDQKGDVLAWSSSGKCGFKGPKKATAYAAGIVVRDVAQKVKPYGLQEVDVYIKGIGSGREAAVRALNTQTLQVLSIKDMTPIPHGGCRPPKVRRV